MRRVFLAAALALLACNSSSRGGIGTQGSTLSSLSLTPTAPTIATGGTQHFSATGTYSDGTTQDLTGEVTWSSSTTTVATISAAGVATSAAAGTTTISGTVSGVTGSTTLSVMPTPTPTPTPETLTITNASAPDGTQNVAYSSMLAATGGTPPYIWSLASGALPPDLSLDAGTGAITGTPTAGSSAFTAQVTDAANATATKALSIAIAQRYTLWAPSAVPTLVDSGPDSAVEVGVKFRSDLDGSVTGIRFYKAAGNAGAHVGNLWSSGGTLLATATFTGETTSGWQQVDFATPFRIDANTYYVASYHTDAGHYSFDQDYFAANGVDSPPLHAPANGVSGANGVYAYGATSTFPSAPSKSANYWVDVAFTATQAAPANEGPGGPVLVLSSASNPFSRYLAEILRAEGFNEFLAMDISLVTSSTLGGYDVVILGDFALTPDQVSLITNWVHGGGNLVAMHPDKQLAALLGLDPASGTLTDAYLLVNTASGPGAGIADATLQFHGSADMYTLNGATAVATLYSSGTTATTAPAVTLHNADLGRAAAFTYDLARSVVYTRQGNPAWSGEERDSITPTRSDDLFFGAASLDPRPDWIDFTKVQIPQADEQQHLLSNLILQMNQARKPLPRFWLLPAGFKAAVVMTGDDHANGGTTGRFDGYIAASPAGCSIADWNCVRGTSYIYSNTPITDVQAQQYTSEGFELALHVTTNCQDFSSYADLDSLYSDQLATFASLFSGLAAPSTNRTHCVVWSDYDSQPKVELAHGIRLDTTYYYWPGTWLNDRPGFMTGSGMPMRFADRIGQIIDVYQAPTQMTDESGQTYPKNIDTLLDNAIGSLGYYGVFTANMHTDDVASTGSDAIVSSALARGVPIVSARQMLEWLDGRNGSSFGSLAWNGEVLSFDVSVASGARNIQAMLPTLASGKTLTSITRAGTPVTFGTQVIKGVSYGIFDVTTSTYQATYR